MIVSQAVLSATAVSKLNKRPFDATPFRVGD